MIKYYCDICGKEIQGEPEREPMQIVLKRPIDSGIQGVTYNYLKELVIENIHICEECKQRRLKGESISRINDKYIFDSWEED